MEVRILSGALSLITGDLTWSGVIFDSNEVVVELQFGEGGTDSKLFVNDLLSAYLRFAERRKLKSELLATEDGHMIVKFTGIGAAQAFAQESGKHVVQRVPPTENNGRRHTSVISVAVLPINESVEAPLKDVDLQITTQRGHGKGGQHQNTTDSAVRMKHIPTGLTVFINGRDQHANKREARKILTARVNALLQGQKNADYSKLRQMQMDGGSRSNKIRTYNFIDSRVVDHRTGKKTSQIRQVMRGEFDLVL